jgi:hypothetical protein
MIEHIIYLRETLGIFGFWMVASIPLTIILFIISLLFRTREEKKKNEK